MNHINKIDKFYDYLEIFILHIIFATPKIEKEPRVSKPPAIAHQSCYEKDCPNTFLYFKNCLGQYQFINDVLLHHIQNIKDKNIKFEDVIGEKDNAFFPQNMANIFSTSDEAILTSQRSSKECHTIALHHNHFINEVTYKKPIYHGGNLLGLCGKTVILNQFLFGNNMISFSQREIEVLAFWIFGFTTTAIAKKLKLARTSVGEYQNRIKVKLNIEQHFELIKLIHEHNLMQYFLTFLHQLNQD